MVNRRVVEMDERYSRIENILWNNLKKGLTGKDLPRLSNEDDFHLIEISGITDVNKLKLLRDKVLSSIFLGDLIRW